MWYKHWALARFLLWQALDVLITISAAKQFPNRVRELNPFFRGDVQGRRWTALIVKKTILTFLVLAWIKYHARIYGSTRKKKKFYINALNILSGISAAVVLWNVGQCYRHLNAQRIREERKQRCRKTI